MKLNVRPVRVADAAQILSILNPIIAARVYSAFDTPFTLQQEERYILEFPARGIFLVAETEAGDIVGFQSMEPFADYTHAFDHVGVLGTYVDLSQRRKGVASRLFAATFELAKEKGYEKIFTFVRAGNDAALATYVGQGFEIVGRAKRHAKIDSEYFDEIMIEKML